MVSMQKRWVRIALYCLWRVLLGCMFALKRIPFWLLALVVFILVAYIFWERKGNQLSAFLGLTNRQTLLLGWAAFGLPFAVSIWFRPMWGHGAILAALAVLICMEWRWRIFSRRYDREDEA